MDTDSGEEGEGGMTEGSSTEAYIVHIYTTM